jgi:hypothetical protein
MSGLVHLDEVGGVLRSQTRDRECAKRPSVPLDLRDRGVAKRHVPNGSSLSVSDALSVFTHFPLATVVLAILTTLVHVLLHHHIGSQCMARD